MLFLSPHNSEKLYTFIVPFLEAYRRTNTPDQRTHHICRPIVSVMGLSYDDPISKKRDKMRRFALTSKFTDSMTSRNTSFFLYLIPSERQDTALVTVAGGRGPPVSSLWPSCVMYLNRCRETLKRYIANVLSSTCHSQVCSLISNPQSIKYFLILY